MPDKSKNLTILFFGDIVGKIGRKAIKKILPELKRKYRPDLILANVENLAHGLGVTERTLREIKEAGVQVFTSGNHIFKKKEVFKILKEKEIKLLRPANYPLGVPGQGELLLSIKNKNILIINLVGRVFFQENFDCPFRTALKILKKYKNKKLEAIIVDFHAEATSEKRALGFFLDGKISALLGTHSHIQTADAQILPQGTAYLTDVGMVGAYPSVIGFKKENILKIFLTQLPYPHIIPEKGRAQVDTLLLEIKKMKVKKIKPFSKIIKI